jgi:hypothetical protein
LARQHSHPARRRQASRSDLWLPSGDWQIIGDMKGCDVDGDPNFRDVRKDAYAWSKETNSRKWSWNAVWSVSTPVFRDEVSRS